MINLSGADQQHSRIQSLIVLTDNANNILAGRTSTVKMKEGALISMMAMGWPPRVAKAIGSREWNKPPNGFVTKSLAGENMDCSET